MIQKTDVFYSVLDVNKNVTMLKLSDSPLYCQDEIKFAIIEEIKCLNLDSPYLHVMEDIPVQASSHQHVRDQRLLSQQTMLLVKKEPYLKKNYVKTKTSILTTTTPNEETTVDNV